MPYELKFTKKLNYKNEDFYWNPCCYGGEIIIDQLMPIIENSFNDIQSNQEDWGWFIWFSNTEDKKNSYGIDVFCDDPERGEYRVQLTSTIKAKSFLWSSSKIINNQALENLKLVIENKLKSFLGTSVISTVLDENYEPTA